MKTCCDAPLNMVLKAATIHGKRSDFLFCPNHLIMWGVKGSCLKTPVLPNGDSAITVSVPCVFCSKDSVAVMHDFKFNTKHDLIDFNVCTKHLHDWIMRILTPKEVKILRKIAGCETFATHGDFYDQEGNSVQPVELGAD